MERAQLRTIARATGCAIDRGRFCFLRDPAMKEALPNVEGKTETEDGAGWLCIATGGSSGGLKFARHDEVTISAAVRGFCAHFDLAQVNAVDVLPPFHVSGLMARVRCAATGGEHVAWNWKRLEADARPEVAGARPWVISLVPTQLQRLLTSPDATAWLRRFEIIFLGGGPVWPELAETAARAELRVSLSYGMTETAAMVTALRPEEFLSGVRSSGSALPHAQVTIDDTGVVTIAGRSVFRGYIPPPDIETSKAQCHLISDTGKAASSGDAEKCHVLSDTSLGSGRTLVTEDLGRIDERGHLHVLGRRDAVIITGGKKVQPLEVEAALRASGEFDDVAIIGLPDAEWGEAVVACYPGGTRKPDLIRAVGGLAAYQRPKRFVAIATADWPRNAQGKVNRAELLRQISRPQ
jgi:O-succinylbenzoic acid--CoA ligase